MKLVNYQLQTPFANHRMGVVVADKIIDLQQAHHTLMQIGELDKSVLLPYEPMKFYAEFQQNISMVKEIVNLVPALKDSFPYSFSLDKVKLETPVPHPSKIICIGTNYADHVKEMGSKIPDYPVLFSKFTNPSCHLPRKRSIHCAASVSRSTLRRSRMSIVRSRDSSICTRSPRANDTN